MNKYYNEFTVSYSDTDNEGLIKIDRIIAYMAEASSWHSESLGLGIDEIRENNYGWMLIKWEVEKNGDERTVQCWK